MTIDDPYRWKTFRVATPEGVFRLRGMVGKPDEVLHIARWKLHYQYGYPHPSEQVGVEVKLQERK